MRMAAVVMFAACLGCGAKPAPTTVVPLEEIAPDLLEAAQKALPNVKFQSARKVDANGQPAFEIRGTQSSGKVREVEISTSGEVLEIE